MTCASRKALLPKHSGQGGMAENMLWHLLWKEGCGIFPTLRADLAHGKKVLGEALLRSLGGSLHHAQVLRWTRCSPVFKGLTQEIDLFCVSADGRTIHFS